MTENYIKTVFILGAGQGIRLRPLTDSCPKPLLPVSGRPIITYAMEHLLALGVERFIVNTHHLAPVYKQVFPENQWRGIPIIFRYEPLLLDTAGGLKNIEDLLEDDDDLLVYNGDVISDLPLQRLLDLHRAAGKEVTLALRSSGEPLNVCLNTQNEVCDLRGELGGQGRNCLFTGIYAVKKSFLNRLQPGRAESVIIALLDMIRERPGSVAGVIIDEGMWYDTGSLEEYEKITRLLPATRGSETKGRVNHSPAEIGAIVRKVLGIKVDQPLEIIPITRGGSARSFYRVCYGNNSSCIFLNYDRDRQENNYYAVQATFLRGIGVSVPHFFYHDADGRVIVMEDLGECDLWHYRQAPWEIRRQYYSQVIDIIEKFHALRPGDASLTGIPLMEAFGPELYRWEREYFQQHFVQGVCGIELNAAETVALEEELALLAAGFDGPATCLLHRDLQSQNVMIRANQPVLIDFQGMRYGHPCYDLASLLYDPYVTFTAVEREELLQYSYRFHQKAYGRDHFRSLFQKASAQRLMQALGAYGFLGRNKPAFLAHIPSGLTNLIEAADDIPGLRLLRNLARRCQEVVIDKREL